jgi:hypothetical protein
MKSSKIIYFSFFLILIACESEEILNPDIKFVEYTVVQAEIQSGKIFPAVRITKTLPLGISYDIKLAELKNVTAYLIKNYVQVIPLVYTNDGLYKPKYDFYVDEGDIYEIYADRDGIFIYGKTTIPFEPSVSSVNFSPSDYYFEADVVSKENEVYGALWIVTGSPPAIADDFFSVSKASTGINQIVSVRSKSLPEEYRNQNYSGQRYIQVVAFDKSFRDYFYSRTSGNEINDPFIQGGGVIIWNMQGENVIGMFVGVAKGDIIQVN